MNSNACKCRKVLTCKFEYLQKVSLCKLGNSDNFCRGTERYSVVRGVRGETATPIFELKRFVGTFTIFVFIFKVICITFYKHIFKNQKRNK